MSAGLRRGDTEYVWPEYLIRPSDVRLVYLDLNHWVSLAKAAVGHRDGLEYVSALASLREAKVSGDYDFPLSLTHIMELAANKQHRQRRDVAGVMEELSGFTVFAPETRDHGTRDRGGTRSVRSPSPCRVRIDLRDRSGSH